MFDETPRTTLARDGEHHHFFSAPRHQAMRGRLLFTSAISHLTLTTHNQPAELFAAHVVGFLPNVRVADDIVTIHVRPPQHASAPPPSARVALHPAVEWELEFRDGVTHLNADLQALKLVALDMGSVSVATLFLPTPIVPSPNSVGNLYFSGSISNVTLRRPMGVGVRLHISGAASQLDLDGQRFDAASHALRWQSANDADATHRYAIGIAGSVSNLSIATP